MDDLNGIFARNFRKKSSFEVKKKLDEICANEFEKPKLFLTINKRLIYGITISKGFMSYFNKDSNSIKFKKYLEILDEKNYKPYDEKIQKKLFLEYGLGAFPEEERLTLKFTPLTKGNYILSTIKNNINNIENFYFFLFKDGIKSTEKAKIHTFNSSLDKSIFLKSNKDYYLFPNITKKRMEKILKIMQPFF